MTVAKEHRKYKSPTLRLRTCLLCILPMLLVSVGRASAFKKARDRLLGTTASHSVFRIRVEKAHCLRHEEGESEQVRVTSADITFVEVGGVESLLGNHDISSEKNVRLNIFFFI